MLLKNEELDIFENIVDQNIGESNITIICFNDTMRLFMSDMCTADIGQDITSWPQNLWKP